MAVLLMIIVTVDTADGVVKVSEDKSVVRIVIAAMAVNQNRKSFDMKAKTTQSSS